MIETCSVASLVGPSVSRPKSSSGWTARASVRPRTGDAGQGAGVSKVAWRAADARDRCERGRGVERRGGRDVREAVRPGQCSGVRWADALSVSVRPVITLLVHGAVLRGQDGGVRGRRDRLALIGARRSCTAWTGGRSGAVGRGAELLVPRARVRPGAAVIAVRGGHRAGQALRGFPTVRSVIPKSPHPYICPAGLLDNRYGHLCEPDAPADCGGRGLSGARPANSADCDAARACPVLATEPGGRLAGHRGFHVQPWGWAAADVDAPGDGQSAGLAGRSTRGCGVGSTGGGRVLPGLWHPTRC